MSELFKEQSLLELTAPTGLDDLNTASTTEIHYRKPSGATGAWNATVDGENLVYDLQNGDIDEPGKWMFQAYVVNGGFKGYGATKTRFFQNHL
jgi:hypothetical protein